MKTENARQTIEELLKYCNDIYYKEINKFKDDKKRLEFAVRLHISENDVEKLINSQYNSHCTPDDIKKIITECWGSFPLDKNHMSIGGKIFKYGRELNPKEVNLLIETARKQQREQYKRYHEKDTFYQQLLDESNNIERVGILKLKSSAKISSFKE